MTRVLCHTPAVGHTGSAAACYECHHDRAGHMTQWRQPIGAAYWRSCRHVVHATHLSTSHTLFRLMLVRLLLTVWHTFSHPGLLHMWKSLEESTQDMTAARESVAHCGTAACSFAKRLQGPESSTTTCQAPCVYCQCDTVC